MLAIKPVDHMSSLLPLIQKSTPTMLPPGIAVQQAQMMQQQQLQQQQLQQQQLQQQQLQQQQLQQLPLQMQMQGQPGISPQASVMNQSQSNSSDLLNQLIHGKKQAAAV